MNPPADTRLVMLIRLVARQDHAALAEFHQLTSGFLLRYVGRLVRDTWDREEAVQDVYRYVWVNASCYSPERSSPMTWLAMIARCRALDSLRSASKYPPDTALDENAFEARGGNPELDHERARWSSTIGGLVKNLPETQRELVRLAFYEEHSHGDIAALTGLPLGTVKSRIRHALRSLREALPVAKSKLTLAPYLQM
jgi:RNA polymerase sigma-70 factor (ECF subfamily)